MRTILSRPVSRRAAVLSVLLAMALWAVYLPMLKRAAELRLYNFEITLSLYCGFLFRPVCWLVTGSALVLLCCHLQVFQLKRVPAAMRALWLAGTFLPAPVLFFTCLCSIMNWPTSLLIWRSALRLGSAGISIVYFVCAVCFWYGAKQLLPCQNAGHPPDGTEN